ncbi:hypothetical protein K8I31_07515 [bacterium]|nr:hypothetical protein [bacterium]
MNAILLGVVFRLSPGGLIGRFLRKPLHTITCVAWMTLIHRTGQCH